MTYETALKLWRACMPLVWRKADGTPSLSSANGLRYDAHLHSTLAVCNWTMYGYGRADAQHFRGVGAQ